MAVSREPSILLTGAGGFLASYCAERFVQQGWRVVGIGRSVPSGIWATAAVEFHRWNLPDSRLDDLLVSLQPLAVVHCAGNSSAPASMTDPGPDFRAGPLLTFELLDAIRCRSAHSRFVFLSSAAVYGNPASLPVTEDQPVDPVSPYGFHKRQAELIGAEFAKVFGISVAIARVFSAYGPFLRRQVVWDLCEKIATNPHAVLQGTGAESRDFIFGSDVACGIERILAAAPMTGEIYNLSSGVETTIAELRDRLAHQFAVQAPLGVLPLARDLRLSARRWGEVPPARFSGCLPPGVPRNWRADVSRMARLGFACKVQLDNGLAQTVAWYIREKAVQWQRHSA